MEICSESIDHFNRSERKLVHFISSCCMSHYHRALLPGTPTLLRGKIMLDKLLIRIMSRQAKRLKQQRDTNKLYKTIIRERKGGKENPFEWKDIWGNSYEKTNNFFKDTWSGSNKFEISSKDHFAIYLFSEGGWEGNVNWWPQDLQIISRNLLKRSKNKVEQ